MWVKVQLSRRTGQRGLFDLLYFLSFLSLFFSIVVPFLFIFLVEMCTLFPGDDLLVSMCLSITLQPRQWIISHERQTPQKYGDIFTTKRMKFSDNQGFESVHYSSFACPSSLVTYMYIHVTTRCQKHINSHALSGRDAFLRK